MTYSFLYVFVFSVALILIQKLDVTIPPLFSLLVTASIASLYFNLINRKHFKKIYSDCFQNISQWCLIMLIVLVMWGTTMVGPGKIGASLFNFIYFAWLGVLGFMLLSLKNWHQHHTKFCFINKLQHKAEINENNNVITNSIAMLIATIGLCNQLRSRPD